MAKLRDFQTTLLTGEVVTVKGRRIKLPCAPDFKLFIYSGDDNDELCSQGKCVPDWTISEETTGAQVANNYTRREVIADAKEKIEHALSRGIVLANAVARVMPKVEQARKAFLDQQRDATGGRHD